VIPIALVLYPAREGVGIEEYVEAVLGRTYLTFRFVQVSLPVLPAQEYVTAETPLGAGLASVMRPPTEDRAARVALHLACLRRIRAAQEAGVLDEARTFLLVNMIATYLPLSEEERTALRQTLAEQGDPTVTTLPANAGSFSGHARPNGPRYRLTARSKPVVLGKLLKAQGLDEHCTDLVTRQREAATGAQMPPLTQILGHRLAADAGLTGTARVHGYGLPAGSFRLADENSDDLAPRGVTNREGQSMILNHVCDRQRFVADHVERLHQLVRGLVLEVPAHVGNLLVEARDTPPLLGPVVTPALLACQAALGSTQTRLRRTQRLRMLDGLAGIGHQERGQPQVDAHGLARGRQGHDGHLTHDDGVPPLSHALERDRLDRAAERAMQLDLERAHALDVEPTILELAAVAVAGEGHAAKAAGRT
jgi:hypothetical protein